MKKSFWLWVIAFVLTIFTAVYQRITGPTYPISGKVILEDQTINYKLDRSYGGEVAHYVEIFTQDQSICGEIIWKRYKTDDDWTSVDMKREGEKLIASLPHQPPASKLLYHFLLQKNDSVIKLPEAGEVIIRFKGDVPTYFLIPHIIFIFSAMLLSTRTGLEFFNNSRKFKPLTIFTFIFLIIGGFVLGPIIEYYAFGAFWTGFPFGHDLIDNKVLIAFIGWLLALISLYKFKNPKPWIIFASILMFIIFLIPHSLLGSELDYSGINPKSKIETQVE